MLSRLAGCPKPPTSKPEDFAQVLSAAALMMAPLETWPLPTRLDDSQRMCIIVDGFADGSRGTWNRHRLPFVLALAGTAAVVGFLAISVNSPCQDMARVFD